MKTLNLIADLLENQKTEKCGKCHQKIQSEKSRLWKIYTVSSQFLQNKLHEKENSWNSAKYS